MDGIILTPLKIINHPKGDIFHAMKKSDTGFDGFGEAYFSTINQNDIKAWKKHSTMTLNLIVPIGRIEFVIFNEISKDFYNVELSKNNYQRLTIKPNLWLALRGIEKYNVLLNLANIEHNSSEVKSVGLNKIKYNWSQKT